MPLQNRVHPSGGIIVTPHRGMYTGNRGIIHNEGQQIVKPFALKAWITCRLEYKNFRRKVMSGRHWTELFFLDEATAFAAGHRPCAFCRNEDFKRFKSLWLQANEGYHQLPDQQMKTIDQWLHTERMDIQKNKHFAKAILSSLPAGTMFYFPGDFSQCFLWHNKKVYIWRPAGYMEINDYSPTDEILLLTPSSIIRTFEYGYKPVIHSSIT